MFPTSELPQHLEICNRYVASIGIAELEVSQSLVIFQLKNFATLVQIYCIATSNEELNDSLE